MVLATALSALHGCLVLQLAINHLTLVFLEASGTHSVLYFLTVCLLISFGWGAQQILMKGIYQIIEHVQLQMWLPYCHVSVTHWAKGQNCTSKTKLENRHIFWRLFFTLTCIIHLPLLGIAVKEQNHIWRLPPGARPPRWKSEVFHCQTRWSWAHHLLQSCFSEVITLSSLK